MRSLEPRERPLGAGYWVLRIALGASVLLAGVDKFFDRLTTWSMYLSPLAEKLLPVPGEVFLRVAGIVEIAIGAAILLRFTRLGAYALCAWLLAIALNLALTGSFWDLALRDVVNALAAFALARLAEWRAAAQVERDEVTGSLQPLTPGRARA